MLQNESKWQKIKQTKMKEGALNRLELDPLTSTTHTDVYNSLPSSALYRYRAPMPSLHCRCSNNALSKMGGIQTQSKGWMNGCRECIRPQ